MIKIFPVVITGIKRGDPVYDFFTKNFCEYGYAYSAWLPYFIAIDNHDGVAEEACSERHSIAEDSKYQLNMANIGAAVIKPDRKLDEEELNVFKIKAAFTLFPKAKYACFLDFKYETSRRWLDILISVLESGEKEGVALASVYNDDPGDTYELEQFCFDVPTSSISKECFGMSRRLYGFMTANRQFDFWKISHQEIVARKTSMSLLKKDGALCDRFIQ